MEKPVEEIADVIKTLCTSKHDEQLACISRYFTRNAEFIHPFCRTPNSAVDSLWAIKQIYAWYKILSPKIDVAVNSVGQSFVLSSKRLLTDNIQPLIKPT